MTTAGQLSPAGVVSICVMVVSVFGVTDGQKNRQTWSERSYLGREHTLYCNDTLDLVVVERDFQLSWTRRGSKEEIVTDKNHELKSAYGVENMALVFRSVTSAMSGIYFCHVKDVNGRSVGTVVKGLNIAGHLYENNGEKYGSNILGAFITGIAVFACLAVYIFVSKYRYLTAEQKRKKDEKKRDRLAHRRHVTEGGVVNMALEVSRGNSLAGSRSSSVYEISF